MAGVWGGANDPRLQQQANQSYQQGMAGGPTKMPPPTKDGKQPYQKPIPGGGDMEMGAGFPGGPPIAGQPAGPFPMPPQGSGGMNPAPGPYSPWGNNPEPVPFPPGGGGQIPMPPEDFGQGAQQPNNPRWSGWNPYEKNAYGGQQITGADPSQADYQSVQQYSDAAYDNSRRYLDPQQETQNKRMAQQLINQGIDPNSTQGRQMQDQLAMQQADQNNAAAFGAMQFGQGIQNQMSQQELANQQIAAGMQQGLWGNQLGASGQGLDWATAQMQNNLGWGGLQNQWGLGVMGNQLGYAGLNNQYNIAGMNNATQRYGYDLGHQLGMGNLDLARGTQEWNELQDMWGNQFDTKSYNDNMNLMRYALINQGIGGNTPPDWGMGQPDYGAERGTSGSETIGTTGRSGG